MYDYIVMINRERDIVIFKDESYAYVFIYAMVVNYEIEDIIDINGFISKNLKSSLDINENESYFYIELSKIRKINKIAVLLIESILKEKLERQYA